MPASKNRPRVPPKPVTGGVTRRKEEDLNSKYPLPKEAELKARKRANEWTGRGRGENPYAFSGAKMMGYAAKDFFTGKEQGKSALEDARKEIAPKYRREAINNALRTQYDKPKKSMKAGK